MEQNGIVATVEQQCLVRHGKSFRWRSQPSILSLVGRVSLVSETISTTPKFLHILLWRIVIFCETFSFILHTLSFKGFVTWDSGVGGETSKILLLKHPNFCDQGRKFADFCAYCSQIEGKEFCQLTGPLSFQVVFCTIFHPYPLMMEQLLVE